MRDVKATAETGVSLVRNFAVRCTPPDPPPFPPRLPWLVAAPTFRRQILWSPLPATPINTRSTSWADVMTLFLLYKVGLGSLSGTQHAPWQRLSHIFIYLEPDQSTRVWTVFYGLIESSVAKWPRNQWPCQSCKEHSPKKVPQTLFHTRCPGFEPGTRDGHKSTDQPAAHPHELCGWNNVY